MVMPRTRRRLAVLGSLAVAGAILVVAPSCGSGFLDGLSGGQRDSGGSDSGIDAPVVDARACNPLHAPPPPGPEVPDTSEPGPIVVALDAVRIDDATNVDASVPATRGFDLDQTCTCPEQETCVAPPDAGRKACDGDGGTDNALGGMFSYLGSIFADEFGPDFATRSIRKGSYGAIFSIGGWNHQPNDPKVVVSVFISQGFEDREDGGRSPSLDGTDVWSIDPGSISDGENNVGADCSTQIDKCFPINISSEAYVSNGFLVARMNIPLALATTAGSIQIRFEDVTLVAKLSQDGSLFRLEGEFVGRWPVNRVLEALSRVPVNDKPLCEQQAFFEVARNEVCATADIMTDKAQDNKGKPCDAVSATIRFSAVSAKLGTIIRPQSPPPICTQFVADCPK